MKAAIGLICILATFTGCLPAQKENFSDATVSNTEILVQKNSVDSAFKTHLREGLFQQKANKVLPPLCSPNAPNTNSRPTIGVY